MRRHAKASSAITHSRIGGVRALALAITVAALALLALAPAVQAKQVDSFIGSPTGASGTTGGLFNNPRGVAVNQAGTGGASAGDVYVVDGVNNRVQQFTVSGTFVRAWGQDVLVGGVTTFEICTVASECKAGTTTGTTANGGQLNNPQGIAIDQATGNVYVTESSNRRVSVFSATGNFLRTFGWDVTTGGVTTFEICTVASECKQAAAAGGNAGQLSTTGYIAVDTSGNVYVADPGNRRVQKFDSAGVFLTTWGWDVVPGGKPGDTGIGLETCPPAAAGVAGDCQAGVGGSGLGQFASNSPNRIAADSAGRVYVTDNSNSRIQSFDSNGGSPAIFAAAELSGSPAPADIAIGSSDRVFVRKQCSATICPGAASPTEQRIKELNSAGALQSTHMAEAGIVTTVLGLAVNTVSGNLYVSTTGTGPGNRVLILDDDGVNPAAEFTLSAPTEVGASGAVLKGTVNPNGPAGFPTSYAFQVSTDGITWTNVGSFTNIGEGTSPVAVQATATGLQPNTLYRVRLAARKLFNAPVPSSVETTFLTDAPGPEATTLPVHSYTDTTAWLAGAVNPNNSPTTYRFEWGKTASYGKQVPFPAASVGTGSAPKPFIAQLTDLEPSTTYHYRIVATGSAGDVAGADRTFTTRAPFEGFAARAYEQATPVEKNGGEIKDEQFTSQRSDYGVAGAIAPDGSAVVFNSWDSFADAEWTAASAISVGTPGLVYQARRNPDGSGWTTKATVPRSPAADNVETALSVLETHPTLYGGTMDAESVFTSPLSMFSSVPDPNLGGGYLIDKSDSTLTELYTNGGTGITGLVAGSEDLDHLAIQSTRLLTADPGVPAAGFKVYEWEDGAMRLVSVDPSGTPFATSAEVGRGGQFAVAGNGSEAIGYHAVSVDGEQIYFSTPTSGAARKIYRRSNGTTTALVSPSKATVPDPLGEKDKRFAGATPAGDKVFFLSSQHLTDDAFTGPARAGADLYRYEPDTETLIDISASNNSPNGAEVKGMLGYSDDGDWVYYAAKGQVLAGQGVAGRANVYLWHDDGTAEGETRFIGTLAPDAASSVRPNDGANFGIDSIWGERRSTARVTPDGQTLLFQSRASVTGYPNNGFAQVYVYEADANGGTGQLSCASCHLDGTPANGHATVPFSGIPSEGGHSYARFFSDDGSRAFFQSEDDLLPEDDNGQQDVYEWKQGRLNLISSGQSEDPSVLWGSSETGDDVFFGTVDRLVGQDIDGLVDIYDARVGGGIQQQNEPPPGEPCVGEACKAAANAQPQSSTPQSSTAPSTGDVSGPVGRKPKPRCAKGKTRRGGKCVAKKRKGAKQNRNRAGRGK